MKEIWIPIVLFAVLGTVMGLILAIASRILAIKRDARIDQVLECLPGANCGGCGYAGCSGYAEAIVKGEASLTACAAGGNEAARAIGEIMGVAVAEQERMVAHVLCSGKSDCVRHRFRVSGLTDCYSAQALAGGDKACAAGCIGLGSCVEKCVFDALSIQDGVAVVNTEKCRACGMCIDVCPKHIIRLVPYSAPYIVQCSTPDKGKRVLSVCDAGCIGCGLCVRNCEAGAIHMEGDMAVIDYAKCTGCGVCVAKCPRKIIREKK